MDNLFTSSRGQPSASRAFEDRLVQAYDNLADDKFFKSSEIKALASPGDILKIRRGFYFHLALYFGDGWVMDIETDRGKKSEIAKICRKTVEQVCGLNLVRINNMDSEARGRYNVGSLPVNQILANAKEDERRGDVPYGFREMNCEYYVTKWRYNNAFSVQAEDFLVNTPGGSILFCLVDMLAALASGRESNAMKRSAKHREARWKKMKKTPIEEIFLKYYKTHRFQDNF